MHRVYEIFEIMPDGFRRRTGSTIGLESAQVKLEELARRTFNECFAADAKTRQIVVHKNIPAAKWRATLRIFHIVYDEETGRERANLLSGLGYGIVSAFSNQAARLLLGSHQHYDLFIVCHGAPEHTRTEMVEWLKQNYPTVKVLAFNPPHQQLLRADYNVEHNGNPEKWLSLVTLGKAAP